MKLALIYISKFHLLSAFQVTVSDSEAAISYLAIELARLGHDVTLFSDTDDRIGACNVRCRKINITDKVLSFDKAILEKDYDALIFKNASPEFMLSVAKALPYEPKVYLWTIFDKDAPINKGLGDPKQIAQIAGIMCVSDWQRDRLLSVCKIPLNKMHTLKYAISPFFQDLFVDPKEFANAKSHDPTLAYTDPSLENLKLMFDAFADVRRQYNGATLSVYSGLHKYGAEDDQIQKLYPITREIRGIYHIGSLSNIQLAAALRYKTILLLPTTVAKTYNVEILEAMAAGVYVLTTNAGALTEYGHNQSKNISLDDLELDDLNGYVSQTLTICQTQAHSFQAFADYCYKQVQEINQKHTWRVRARELIYLLTAKS